MSTDHIIFRSMIFQSTSIFSANISCHLHMLGGYQVTLVVKNLPAIACRHKRHQYDLWSGRSLGGGHGKPFQYSCLENPLDRGAWWAIVHRVAKSPTWLKWLSMHACTYTSLHPTWLSMYPISIKFLFMMIWSHYSAVYKYSDFGCYHQVSLNFSHDHLGVNFYFLFLFFFCFLG